MKDFHVPSHRRPTPPGELLLEEFLKPLSVTQASFAERIGVTRARLHKIVSGKANVAADMALRLERALVVPAQFWLNAQLVVDLYDTRHSAMAKQIRKIKPLPRAT